MYKENKSVKIQSFPERRVRGPGVVVGKENWAVRAQELVKTFLAHFRFRVPLAGLEPVLLKLDSVKILSHS